jgi:hypothetical protein
VRELRQLARELLGHNLARWDPSRVQLLNAAQLVGLQPQRVAKYVTDCFSPSLGAPTFARCYWKRGHLLDGGHLLDDRVPENTSLMIEN